jgi:hypothetical protein
VPCTPCALPFSLSGGEGDAERRLVRKIHKTLFSSPVLLNMQGGEAKTGLSRAKF